METNLKLTLFYLLILILWNGKFGGVSNYKNSGYRVRYNIPSTGATKKLLFPLKKYGNDKEKCFNAAYKYLLQKSNEYDKTGNKIRMTNEGHLEVSLTNDRILLIDTEYLDLVQLYRISVTNKGYAQFYINSNQVSVHILLTGYEFNDHDNRNRLDCRIKNLLESCALDNNHNKGVSKTNTSGITGINFSELKPGKFVWVASIQYDWETYSKSYSVKKYTYLGALEKAIEKRIQFTEQFGSLNGLKPGNLGLIINKEKLIKTTQKYLEKTGETKNKEYVDKVVEQVTIEKGSTKIQEALEKLNSIKLSLPQIINP